MEGWGSIQLLLYRHELDVQLTDRLLHAFFPSCPFVFNKNVYHKKRHTYCLLITCRFGRLKSLTSVCRRISLCRDKGHENNMNETLVVL